MGTAPRLSLIIPAYNEAEYLPRLLDTVETALACYDGGTSRVEVVVADNDSTDGTAAIAHARGCRVAHTTERRIASARNAGAKIARGEILCFVDADYRIHPETFNAIDEAMSTGRYVGGATGARMERMSVGIGVTMLGLLPLLATGVDAGVWFCWREDFDAVGGYDENLLASEDVRFLWAIKRRGRAQRPRRTLARLSNWGSFWRTMFDTALDHDGEPADVGVRAIVSARKFDKHGDWHFLVLLPRMALQMVFAPKKFERDARTYWYEDR
ncbi:MAG: glycosyltransferase [Planctomycetota bacterium]|jgi:glycosyltransferase involved in cell wall biosynthesis